MDPFLRFQNHQNLTDNGFNSTTDFSFTSITEISTERFIKLEIFPEPYLSILLTFFILSALFSALFDLYVIMKILCMLFNHHQSSNVHTIYNNKSSPANRVPDKKALENDLLVYLLNLFVTAFFMALCSPFLIRNFMYGQWLFWSWLCPVGDSLSVFLTTANAYALSSIGLERYIIIGCPLEINSIFKRNTKWIILIIWLISLILVFPIVMVTRATSFLQKNQKVLFCKENWENSTNTKIYTDIMLLFTFLVPLASLIFSFISIYKAYSRQAPGDRLQNYRKSQALQMLIILSAIFVLCFLPLNCYNMIMYLCGNCKFIFAKYVNTYVVITLIFQWLMACPGLYYPIIFFLNIKNLHATDNDNTDYLEMSELNENDNTIDNSQCNN